MSLSLKWYGGWWASFSAECCCRGGHRFQPNFGHLELISPFLVLIQQQSEPLVEEQNMLTTIRTIGRGTESVVGCKQAFLRVDGCCCVSVHVPTSFCCCCEIQPVVLRDEKCQSVFLCCYHANALFLFGKTVEHRSRKSRDLLQTGELTVTHRCFCCDSFQ